MLDQFEQWLRKVREEAVATKMKKAKEAKIVNWKKIIWKAPDQNTEIKAKFRKMSEILEPSGQREVKCKSSERGGEWLYDLVWRRVDQARRGQG